VNISEVEVTESTLCKAGCGGEGADTRLCSSLVSLPTFVRSGEKVPLEVLEMLTSHTHLYHVLLHNYPNLLVTSQHTITQPNVSSLIYFIKFRSSITRPFM
jgi:hypothetical protein